eukprot:CAMPEP_0177662208 /NCGR_PEP_ID=MMETSP0447-20121125/19149_1 /TAXON_ID=0 /ORGANISM="Stygamoeba regulata, Strain BSH-02190019" /LENGTH=40 /DNA_ID= /DNA_START= /DNA_END= /DNA_ORIENTATION=
MHGMPACLQRGLPRTRGRRWGEEEEEKEEKSRAERGTRVG